MTNIIASRNRAGLMGPEHAKIIENISTFAKTFLDDADATAVKATLGLTETLTIWSTSIAGSPAAVAFSVPSSGYAAFLALWSMISTNRANGSDNMLVETSIDSGATYRTSSGDYRDASGSTSALATLGVAGSTASTKASGGALYINGLGNSSRFTSAFVVGAMRVVASTTVAQNTTGLIGVRMAAEAETHIRFRPEIGTAFENAGKITLVGIKEL